MNLTQTIKIVALLIAIIALSAAAEVMADEPELGAAAGVIAIVGVAARQLLRDTEERTGIVLSPETKSLIEDATTEYARKLIEDRYGDRESSTPKQGE